MHNIACSQLESNDRLNIHDHPLKHLNDFHGDVNFHEMHTSTIIRNLNHSACPMNQERHNLTNHGNNQMNYNFSSFANLSCHESLSFGIAYCFPITSLGFSHDISKSYLSVALDAHIFISYNTSSNGIIHMKSLILHSFSSQNYVPSIDLILHTQNLRPKFHDKVADWLERSYFERFPCWMVRPRLLEFPMQIKEVKQIYFSSFIITKFFNPGYWFMVFTLFWDWTCSSGYIGFIMSHELCFLLLIVGYIRSFFIFCLVLISFLFLFVE